VFYVWLMAILVQIISSIYVLAAASYHVVQTLLLIIFTLYVIGLTVHFHACVLRVRPKVPGSVYKTLHNTALGIIVIFAVGTILQLILLPILAIVLTVTGFEPLIMYSIVTGVVVLMLVWQGAMSLWARRQVTDADDRKEWLFVGLLSFLQLIHIVLFTLATWFNALAVPAAGMLAVWMAVALWPGVIRTRYATVKALV